MDNKTMLTAPHKKAYLPEQDFIGLVNHLTATIKVVIIRPPKKNVLVELLVEINNKAHYICSNQK